VASPGDQNKPADVAGRRSNKVRSKSGFLKRGRTVLFSTTGNHELLIVLMGDVLIPLVVCSVPQIKSCFE
jgi:hypothetical protein